jgi:hypothetical protein
MPGIEFKELAAPFVVEQVHSTGLATWLKVQHGSHWCPVKSLSKRWDMVGCSTPFVSGSLQPKPSRCHWKDGNWIGVAVFFNGQAFQATVVNVIDCNSSTFFRFFVETSGEHAR